MRFRLGWVQGRLLRSAGALLLIFPGPLSDVLGLVLILLGWVRGRRSPAQGPEEAVSEPRSRSGRDGRVIEGEFWRDG